jgi:hypothetical protein
MITYSCIDNIVPDHIAIDAFSEPDILLCDICGNELDDEGNCENCDQCKSMYKED